MDGEPVYGRADVLWRQTYDRVMVLVPGRSDIVTLQGSGCALWAALADPDSVAGLAERLSAAYGAPADQIAADIMPVLTELVEEGAAVIRGRTG